jgi:hypothetical protein
MTSSVAWISSRTKAIVKAWLTTFPVSASQAAASS